MEALKHVVSLSAVLAFTTAVTAAPTWEYDADSGNLPNATGEPFAGGTANAAEASIVDLGGGDLVLRIDTMTDNVDTSTYFQQNPNTTPGTEWNVDPTVGYSVEWNVQLDDVLPTQVGSADLIFADGLTATTLRLIRSANGGAATAIIKSGLNNDTLDLVSITAPNEFHTFRIDKINNSVDLYIDGVLMLDDVVDTNSSTLDFLRVGDGTGNNDGKHDTQFLRTYQNGVIPEPASLGLLGVGGLMLLGRRRGR